MAGRVGIAPTQGDLEFPVLLLHQRPIRKARSESSEELLERTISVFEDGAASGNRTRTSTLARS